MNNIENEQSTKAVENHSNAQVKCTHSLCYTKNQLTACFIQQFQQETYFKTNLSNAIRRELESARKVQVLKRQIELDAGFLSYTSFDIHNMLDGQLQFGSLVEDFLKWVTVEYDGWSQGVCRLRCAEAIKRERRKGRGRPFSYLTLSPRMLRNRGINAPRAYETIIDTSIVANTNDND